MMQSSGFLKVVECWRETVDVDVSIVGRLESGGVELVSNSIIVGSSFFVRFAYSRGKRV
jgi:hypothetical protein